MGMTLVSTRIVAKIEINVDNWLERTHLNKHMSERGWRNIPFPTHPTITVWEKFFDDAVIMQSEMAELKAELPKI